MRYCDLSSHSSTWFALGVFGALALGACSSGSDSKPGVGGPGNGQAQSFESDLPSTASGGSRSAGEGESASGTADDSAAGPGAVVPAEANPAGGDASSAERAIVEADIVQVAGNQLFALSRVAGLSVIDIANPAQLRILGSYRKLTGTPFEMYLRDGVAIVMFTSWGQYERKSDGSYEWAQTSKVVALDTSNPAAIQQIGSFDVAGEVSDSRLVGDVMYVVGYQNGSCWRCDQKPLTSVLSLNLQNPRAIQRVDELKFESDNQYGWGQRSISVTAERIYIAGPEYGESQPTGSTIQVVDIANPSGDLVAGAQLPVAGQISSRWQFDEYQKVLRVISQPWSWATQGSVKPAVQTFTVASSQEITPLGRTDLDIPRNEQLRTVRFDGPRAYAITALQTDPLFTIDLANPAAPRQVGELQMPGWVYYLEPRGERVIGLGYDQNNSEGAVTVSIFDVTNLATPRMLSRVNFGGDWAYLPEDQDRIHKSFKVLDELGLILVPFSGYSNWSRSNPSASYCYSGYRSGVQLVDFAGDTLTARGMAPSRGEARRALVQGTSLLTVSDEAVDAFDLTNRAAPASLGQLTLARNVRYALPLPNGHVARVNQDWYSQNSTIDFVPLADVDKPNVSVGELRLSEALRGGTDECPYNTWIENAYVQGTQLNVTFGRYNYDGGKYSSKSGVLTVDAADPSRPAVASRIEWVNTEGGSNEWYVFSNYYNYVYMGAQTNAVRTERALVTLEGRYRASTVSGPAQYELRLRVVDLTDAKAPSVTTLALPEADGYGGLVVDGANVLLSRYEGVSTGRARFYLDRVDLSDPKQPKISEQLNVPGALVHLMRDQGRALTSELVRTVVDNITADDCYKRFAYADFLYRNNDSQQMLGTCNGYTQRLELVRFVQGGVVLEDTVQLGERERLSSSSLGAGRIVAVLSHGDGAWYGVADDCIGSCGYSYAGGEPAEVLVLGGFEAGKFEQGRLTVSSSTDPWWGFYGAPPVYAFGTRALVNSQDDAAIVDTSVITAPQLVRTVPLFGYAQSAAASGNLVLLALGMNGVERVDL